MRLSVEPRRAVATPGTPTTLGVVVTNGSDVISGYVLRVLGADPSWVEIEDPSPRLFPGESVSVAIVLTLPEGIPAGERRVAVQVRDVTDQAAIAIEDVTIDVPALPRTTVSLEPATVTAGKVAAFAAVVRNDGNTVQHARLVARDPEAATTYTFDPDGFSLAPGQSTSVALAASAKRPFVGDPLLRPFELRLDGPSAPAGGRAAGRVGRLRAEAAAVPRDARAARAPAGHLARSRSSSRSRSARWSAGRPRTATWRSRWRRPGRRRRRRGRRRSRAR